jgi:hypothetical protein
MPMQTQEHDPVLRAEHDDSSGAPLEQYESGDSAPGSQRSGDNYTAESAARERELQRYDDEEIATKPWPPLHY